MYDNIIYCREWRKRNPEYSRQWDEKNREKRREISKKYYKKYQEKNQARSIKYYRENREHCLKIKRIYDKNNPEKKLISREKTLTKQGKFMNMTCIEYTYALMSWSRCVKKRDNYVCIWCKSTENLNADHIKPKKDFPKLALKIENGRTLCKTCHIKRHGAELD